MIGMSQVWGQCRFRELRYIYRSGFHYICGKDYGYCDPIYCLGPDEDMKGEDDEEREDN